MDTAKQLYIARRDLDKMKGLLSRAILDTTTHEERHQIPELMDLYYSTDHAKCFDRKVKAWIKVDTRLMFRQHMAAVQEAFSAYEVARAAEKLGKVARKAERAAKAADRKALRGNKAPAHVPREVFDLSRKTLRDAMQPQFADYQQQIFLHLFNRVDSLLERLEAHGGDAKAAAASPKTWDEVQSGNSWNLRQIVDSLHSEIRKWSQPKEGKGWDAIRVRRSALSIEAELEKQAFDITDHDFDTYSIKLAGKIALPIESAKITGKLWSCSFLIANIESGFWNGSTRQPFQRWKTQMILNTSVLGKLFNQWPTRRVA